MLVTIVIPAYNAGQYLEATIDSVRRQSYTKWELIIVDGGSSDNTFDIAEDWGERDHRIIAMRQRSGNAVNACNTGLAHRSKSSRYLLFLDHDDVLAPYALAELVHALETEPEMVAAYGRFRFMDDDGNVIRTLDADRFTERRIAVHGNKRVRLNLNEPLGFTALAYRNCIASTGQVLMRTNAVHHLGPFDPATFPCDDWDMWVRLSLFGGLRLVDVITLEYRMHEGKRGLPTFDPDPDEITVRRKLATSLAGLEAGRLVLTAWKLREWCVVEAHLRRAAVACLTFRYAQARSEYNRASDYFKSYWKHWGWFHRQESTEVDNRQTIGGPVTTG